MWLPCSVSHGRTIERTVRRLMDGPRIIPPPANPSGCKQTTGIGFEFGGAVLEKRVALCDEMRSNLTDQALALIARDLARDLNDLKY